MPSRTVQELIIAVAALKNDVQWIKKGIWVLASGIVTVFAQNFFK